MESRTATDKLHFNGINGRTGKYGLQPMPSEQLAERILSGTQIPSDSDKAFKKTSRRSNVGKVAAIARFLAESNFDKVQRDDSWRSQWLDRLVKTLATELLTDEYATPDRIAEIKNRLETHTVDKIEQIIDLLLAQGYKEDLQALAVLLLQDNDEEPDNQSALERQLSRDTLNKLMAIQTSALAASRAQKLEGNSPDQRIWLQELVTSLHMVALNALNATQNPPGSIKHPKRPLVNVLEALARETPGALPWLDMLLRDLQAQSQMSWHELLECLQRGLQARIADCDESITWSDLLEAMRNWLTALQDPISSLGVIEGVDATRLCEAGWGIIFPHEDPQTIPLVPKIKKALEQLLLLRASQAKTLFKIYEGSQGFRPNDTAKTFLQRHGATPSNPADPQKVPYYLLIVGNPETIPFHFQYQLDVQYAVGRIDFGDDLAAYANYARNVVRSESGQTEPSGQAAFLGVDNPGDTLTNLSAKHLVQPLFQRMQERFGSRLRFSMLTGETAKKDYLANLLGGDDTPSFLFAACHGMEFDKDGAGEQLQRQGALLCQDWEGPGSIEQAIPQSYYLSGEDLGEDRALQGLIAFFFACFSAGTPRFDQYTKQAFRTRAEAIAERAFVAALPKAMLSLPKGGALAVIGHIDRVWGTSFLDQTENAQIAVFQSALERLFKGEPVGHAMEYMNTRYAALSTELTHVIEQNDFLPADPYQLAEIWTANNDARGYVVIGDPAVRLCLPEGSEDDSDRDESSKQPVPPDTP